MASEIEAEMARFEEEVLGSENANNEPPVPTDDVSDLPPPPMFVPNQQNDFDSNETFQPDMGRNNNENDMFFDNDPGHRYNEPNMDSGPMPGPPPMANRQFPQDSMSGMGPEPRQMHGPGPGPDHNFDRMMGPGPMSGPMGPGPGPRHFDRMMGPGPGPMPDRMGPRPMDGPMHGRGPNYDRMMGPGHMPGPGPMSGPDYNFEPRMGPGPMHGMGPMNNMQGPMMPGPNMPNQFPPGPGPMPIGPGMPPGMQSMNSVITGQPKVYSSAPVIMKPPQIVKATKRKAESLTVITKDKINKDAKNGTSQVQPPSYNQAMDMPQFGGPSPMGSSTNIIGPKMTPGSGSGSTSFIPPIMHRPSNSSNAPTPPMAFSQANAASGYNQGKVNQAGKKKRYVRTAAGTSWEDPTLLEWDPNDYRIFCGDLGNEVTDDMLMRVFNKYPSFQRAKVVREKGSKKTKGYGFVSFKDPNDFIRAMREMNGKYVGNRPIKLRKSNWKDRNIDMVKKKLKEKKKLGYKV